VFHQYGVDSAVTEYSYFHQTLLDRIILKMNTQLDEEPMESIATLLQEAQYPTQALISIGATRYTDF